MRWIAIAGLALSMTACGNWKGDGNDELLPDELVKAGVKPWFGDPVQVLTERADDNVRENRKADEPEEAHGAAPEAAPHHRPPAPAHP